MLCEKGDAETCAAFRRGGRYAARAGDSVTLRDLVDHGWDARSDRDRRKASALHWAAGHGALEACGVLIDRGKVPVNDREGSGATPLHWALVGVDGNAFGVGARLEAATFLLDQRGADPRAATDDKNACVHWAAWAGGLEALRLLVRHGAELDVVNERGCGVAHWAAAGGDVDTLEFLAAQGVDLAQCNNANHTPLEHAVAYGRIDAADWFLRRGIVDSSAAQYALTLAQYQPEDTNRVAIATGLAPFRVPSL